MTAVVVVVALVAALGVSVVIVFQHPILTECLSVCVKQCENVGTTSVKLLL